VTLVVICAFASPSKITGLLTLLDRSISGYSLYGPGQIESPHWIQYNSPKITKKKNTQSASGINNELFISILFTH